jgi:hypothetical protein
MDGRCSAKTVDEQAGSGLSFPIALLEALLGDDAPLIEQEDARIRRALMALLWLYPIDGVLLVDMRVEEAHLFDDLAADV